MINYMIQRKVQWNLERALLIGTCWELNCEILRNAGHFGTGLICLGLFGTWKVGHFGQFSDWVISVFGCFGQSLKVIMYALLYVYEWTAGQVLSFVKKIRLKCKKGPFMTETTLVKIPQAGPKWSVNITLWLGEIKRIYRENNSKT